MLVRYNNDEKMNKQIPGSLKIVAWLFLFSGVTAVIEVLVGLMNSQLHLNLGVLGIFVGIGLLRLREVWRICGLVIIWIGIISMPIIVLLFLSHSGPLDLNVFGQKVGQVEKDTILLPVLLLYALVLWQRWVLSRADIKALFSKGQAE